MRMGRRRTCRTEPTAEERKWWGKLTKLWAEMPETMVTFADGSLHAVDRELSDNYDGRTFQPLELLSLPDADGGDPWSA